MVVDMVESSRLLEANEAATIRQWLGILRRAECDILPRFDGRLVRSLGDGMLLEFQGGRSAVSAAFAIHELYRRENLGRPPQNHLTLRAGVETSGVAITQYDVFGHGVSLAARLATLAAPGETVVSARVREQLTPALDADIEDLGDCYLKHLAAPVRAYRVAPPGLAPVGTLPPCGDARPAIAVVPFACRNPDGRHQLIGEVLAEDLIQELSCSPDLSVISRLSTAPFRKRGAVLSEIRTYLHADYVLSGTYAVSGPDNRLFVELAEVESGHVAWSASYDKAAALLQGTREFVAAIAAEVRKAVMLRELRRSRLQPLPTLKSYTLLIAAITLMHRMSVQEFDEARRLLDAVIDRARRQALPHAWLAQWFVLRVQQGWSPDPKRDACQALESSKRALEADPDCSLALAVDGLVQTHFFKRLDIARARYAHAVQRNPNDALAWLLKGTMHAFVGEGRTAVGDTRRAIMLSPLDPHRYYYDSLAGTACLAAQDYEGALRHATLSLRANRTHTSTLRVATIAAWHLGLHDQARRSARRLLKLEPCLTIERYRARSPATPFETGKDWSEALRQAGVPA